jgi:muramidase (phage lysozyme)
VVTGDPASMIPAPALEVLALIRMTETGPDPVSYETIYGHHQDALTKPITQMTVAELQHWQPGFTETWGSSASGAYQFMFATLGDLLEQGCCKSDDIFDPELQDKLGFDLLQRRGYDEWVAFEITTDEFMIGLAKEWASFPVPYDMQGAHQWISRGQSYYAGDAVNKALVSPDEVWMRCEAARASADETGKLFIKTITLTSRAPILITIEEET